MQPLTTEAAHYIAHNMRDSDRAEVFSVRWSDDVDDFAEECVKSPSASWYIGTDRPVVMFGIAIYSPGVGTVWLAATDELVSISLQFARAAKRIVTRALGNELHRLQAVVMAGNTAAVTFIEWLGFTLEALMRRYRKDGGDAYLYARTA